MTSGGFEAFQVTGITHRRDQVSTHLIDSYRTCPERASAMDEVEKLKKGLGSIRAKERQRAIGRTVGKRGGSVVRHVDDPGVIPLLRGALKDANLFVRRSAALALRPWIEEQPDLFQQVLPEYAIQVFDGRYTHVGLLDTRDGEIWIPPLAALGGHAAMMADGSTDRYFKFQFYVPNQSPPGLKESGTAGDAHLSITFIADWCYTSQTLIDATASAQVDQNLREQEGHERKVIAFYRESKQSFGVTVHREIHCAGQKTVWQRATDRLAMLTHRVKLVVGSRYLTVEDERVAKLGEVYLRRVGSAVADNWDEHLLVEEGLL